MTAYRLCPAPGCKNRKVGPLEYACRLHWYSLPDRIRRAVLAAPVWNHADPLRFNDPAAIEARLAWEGGRT